MDMIVAVGSESVHLMEGSVPPHGTHPTLPTYTSLPAEITYASTAHSPDLRALREEQVLSCDANPRMTW